MRTYLLPVLLAAAVATPAAASLTPDQTQSVWKVGRCIVDKDRDSAVSLLGRLPLSGGDVTVSLPAACAQQLPAGSALALRGGIAKALFHSDIREFGMAPKRSRDDLVDLNLPVDPAGGADPRTVQLYRLGDCVVRNEMERTANFLESAPGSRLEMTFYDRMRPTMSACQTADAKLAVNRADLRSVLAQSYYSAAARYYKGQLKHADPR